MYKYKYRYKTRESEAQQQLQLSAHHWLCKGKGSSSMLGYRDSARDIGPRKATVAARRPPHLRPLRRRLEFSAAPHALAQVVTPERALARYALGEFRRSTVQNSAANLKGAAPASL